jgi:hypothetical protein
MTMTLKTKRKITTTLSPEQVEIIQTISAKTRIAQSELFREAVDDLIKKYQGAVTEDFAKSVDDYMEKRQTLMKRLAK